MGDSRSRKWLVTINNPLEKGYTREVIKEKLSLFKGCIYWCASDEIGGEEHTPHTHIFFYCENAVKFSTVKERFEGGHFDMCKGTCAQNRDYVFKQGKHAKTEKAETSIEGTQEEFGEMPIERQGQRNDLADLYDMILQGMTDDEIIENCPNYMFNLDKFDKIRQMLRSKVYSNTLRNVKVTYIYGTAGSGKTRAIYEKYGFKEVYRVTDYQHPFDNYNGQSVLVFEEFRSSLKIQDMLSYLDIYPLELPSRYNNKVACFETVYIVSNISLSEQYPHARDEEIETYKAFLRRIGAVIFFNNDNVYYYNTLQDYNKGIKVPSIFVSDDKLSLCEISDFTKII
ncbi:MAG: replication protein [Ruminococcus sp.]|nr:replication protein [Ruminococcus sp.]